MMQPYLVHLKCLSPYLTPWRNCTVWGRLCWTVASGAVPGWTIADWIERHRAGLFPLIVGDGLPFDALPVPAIFLAKASGPQKKPKTLPWPQWLELCQTGIWPADAAKPSVVHEVQRQHVKIDRATGTALEGQLRTEQGSWPSGGIVMAAWVDDALGVENFRQMLQVLCTEGWGYGRNYGYGRIELASLEPLNRPAATGYVATLGHCHPTDDLPQDGFWRWTGVPILAHDPNTRRAVVSERFTTARFTTMLAPGATFKTDQPQLGRIIQAQLPPLNDYLHNGLAPTWPVHYPEEMHG